MIETIRKYQIKPYNTLYMVSQVNHILKYWQCGLFQVDHITKYWQYGLFQVDHITKYWQYVLFQVDRVHYYFLSDFVDLYQH